jgi:ketosteroid isomerase-like protein
MGNRETVQAMYEAFGRGDVPAILERVSEDVRWESFPNGNAGQDAGVPWLAERRGRDGVAEFFAIVGEAHEYHSFECKAVLADADETYVAALIEIDVTVRATGHRLRDEHIHLWTFGDDGLVTALQHHVDTVKHARAEGVLEPALAVS